MTATKRGSIQRLISSVALCLGVGYAGSRVTDTTLDTWYRDLTMPAATPPDWVFPVVWTTLFVLMGVACGRVCNLAGAANVRPALLLFAAQLALNLGWSMLFFGLRSPGLALLEILVLWGAILATSKRFARFDRAAGLLLAPYLAWVSFAAYLNFAIWRLNP